jgi:5-methylcytosine-specific restriction endonuclease McrA
MHECTECHGLFVAKDVTVDHIVPVVPLGGHDSWDEVIERLFCELDGLQVLCQPCHKVKTAEENATRKQLKKEKQNATKATK